MLHPYGVVDRLRPERAATQTAHRTPSRQPAADCGSHFAQFQPGQYPSIFQHRGGLTPPQPTRARQLAQREGGPVLAFVALAQRCSGHLVGGALQGIEEEGGGVPGLTGGHVILRERSDRRISK